MDITYSLT
jgi:hypothetical protein